MESYRKLLHLEDARLTRVDHLDAMVASVYRVDQKGKKPLILKIHANPKDYFREIYFLKRFAGVLPVPKVIETVDSEAILMEWIPGELLNHLTNELAEEIGRLLALIHSSRMEGYGDPVGKLNQDPRTYFTFKFNEGLEECCEHLPLNIIQKCRIYFEEHLDLLVLVDGPCATHRDFRPGNLIIHDGKLRGIIDWAGARASFAEEDLFSIEPWAKGYFERLLKGYREIRPLPNFTSLTPFLKVNKAIATIGFLVKRGTWNTSHSPLYQEHLNVLNLIF